MHGERNYEMQTDRPISGCDDFYMGTDHEFPTAASRENRSYGRYQMLLLRQDGIQDERRLQRARTALHARPCRFQGRQGRCLLLLRQRPCFLLQWKGWRGLRQNRECFGRLLRRKLLIREGLLHPKRQ